MILVDSALARREADGNPVRVGLIGAGFMGRGIALQIVSATPGMQLAAVYNRDLEGARRACEEAGLFDPAGVATALQADKLIRAGRTVITDDPGLICDADSIDAIIEVTGTVHFALDVVLHAIDRCKHVVLMNAELDGTVGPQLRRLADQAGVIYTNVDGDQPGVIMNLYRFVRGIGVKPVLCGNIKGLQDPYRNPTTQESYARQWKQRPHMVTSFADGTKISFEQAIVANATGMRVARRGMHGFTVEPGTSIREAVGLYPLEDLLSGPGIVDYLVGPDPAPGVFVLGTHDHPVQQHYLNLYKLGEGPLYVFYTPYHLCHFEVPATVARAVLFADAAIAPAGPPRVDVVTTAKRELKAGERLDGIGYYMTYGQAENADIAHAQRLLPIGLAEGCTLRRDMARDEVLGYDDVIIPEGRVADRIRAAQTAAFFGAAHDTQGVEGAPRDGTPNA